MCNIDKGCKEEDIPGFVIGDKRTDRSGCIRGEQDMCFELCDHAELDQVHNTRTGKSLPNVVSRT